MRGYAPALDAEYRTTPPSYAHIMRTMRVMMGIGLLTAMPSVLLSQPVEGIRPLLAAERSALRSILPSGTQLLHEPAAIEKFLEMLDGAPPEWGIVYGPHGTGHDDRLFALNRLRDRLRAGREVLTQEVTFFWSGELSSSDPSSGGFRVAIGPKLIPTRWGLVRFKPEDLPSELVAVPQPDLREALRRRMGRGEHIEIEVAMTGRLAPDESIIYDFAHEQPGQGMVMPVVRIERLDYLMVR